jgi:hypothetical protein
LLWLTIAYPVSSWPVDYFYGRGSIPAGGRIDTAVDVLYWPMREVLHGPAGIRPAFRWSDRINGFFIRLDRRHAASD